ncbi:MAG: archease [Candidatus Zixiibacteriota bacterium]
MPYKFVDDIATADCAVAIQATTLESLFCDAARALVDCMTDISIVQANKTWGISLDEDNLERLLYSWLSELVFIRDSENVLFSDFNVEIAEDAHSCHLRADIMGENIDHDRHDMRADVKAVTMHMFRIEKEADTWRAFVIFDL